MRPRAARFFVRLALATLAGVAGGLAYFGSRPGPDAVVLAFVAYVPLLLLVESEAARDARSTVGARLAALVVPAWAGFVFALVANVLLGRDMPPIVSAYFLVGPRRSAAAVAALATYHALGGALFAVATVALRRRGASLAFAALAPFVALEWGYPRFGHDQLAVSVVGVRPLAAIASLGGVELVGACVVATSLVLAALLQAMRARALHPLAAARVPAALVVGLALAAALARAARGEVTGDALRVAVVQPNHDVARPELRPDSERRLLAMTTAALGRGPVDLAIWPESATAGALEEAPDASTLRRLAQSVPVLFGTSVRDHAGTPRWNSAFLLGPEASIRARYDKVGLMPFGERLPLSEHLPPSAAEALHLEEAIPGDRPAIVRVDDRGLGVFLCYEDVLPGLAFEAFHARVPDVLVTLSNDGWFDRSDMPVHHFALSRFRAIEWGRPLVRVTQTGVSALVGPSGEVLEALAPRTPLAEVWQVPPARGRTLFSVVGPWPGPLALVLALAFLARRRLVAWRARGRRSG